jgi:2-(1,2-epoxy-1,2-dihydrophenyl)acetyl-CoA isomerase
MADVLYETRGKVAVVTLNRPEALNAFTTGLRAELNEALWRAETSSQVRAVVLTGAGRCLSAGADLKEVPASGAAIARQLQNEYGVSLRAIATMPKPVLTAVAGFAAGIGVSYALVSDVVVMGSSAYLLVPFSKIGLVPDGGLGALLGARLGHRRAFELAMSGERLAAARCVELGLANRVVADDRVLPETLAWAEQLAQCAPIAMALTKRAVRDLPLRAYAEGIAQEAEWQARCVDSADSREGIAAFLEKRPPRFTGL